MTNYITRFVRAFFRDEAYLQDMAFYRRVQLFHGLTRRQLGKIMQGMQKRKYYAGETLFHEGQIGKAVFIIRSGTVELSRHMPNGNPRVLGRIGPGQIFGEMALLEDRARNANARIVDDGEVALLYTATLENIIRDHPRIGVKILRNISVLLASLLRMSNAEMDKRSRAA